LFSGIGVAAVAEFEKDSQTLLRRHGGVLARVGLIGLLEAGKDPYLLLHVHIIVCRAGAFVDVRHTAIPLKSFDALFTCDGDWHWLTQMGLEAEGGRPPDSTRTAADSSGGACTVMPAGLGRDDTFSSLGARNLQKGQDTSSAQRPVWNLHPP